MRRTVRRTDQRPPKFQAADSSLCQMRHEAEDHVYSVCTLVGSCWRRCAKCHVHHNYLASAIASDYGRSPGWANGRHRGSRFFNPSQCCIARHCLLPVQVMRPNPALKWDAPSARPLAIRYAHSNFTCSPIK
jgi:hypothetical protein